jgi:hypothetical protein
MDTKPFEAKQAVRQSIPLWVAVAGPSGGGKTLSALRLATGIQRVTGGKIAVLDTEADRALTYAPREGERATPPLSFNFQHVSFGAPFGSARYLEAVTYCVEQGAKVVVIDSFSHEHEGPGGLLEQFEEELERLSGGDEKKAERVKMLAWKRPKMDRRRMINGLLQLPVSIIAAYRCKDKIQIKRGEDPKKLGFMPITGDEMIFEFPTRFLLKPGSDGVPTLDSHETGEREWIRLPQQFRDLMERPRQLDEEIGQRLAEWSSGGAAPSAANGNGKADARGSVVKDILRLSAKVGMDDARRRGWLTDVFKADHPKNMELSQLEDARALLSVWADQGEEDYGIELASMRELGRVA